MYIYNIYIMYIYLYIAHSITLLPTSAQLVELFNI